MSGCAKQHPLIGIGVMIKNDNGEVLLGLRKGPHGAGEWSFPGGHLKFGETIFEAAKREVKEETGLDVNIFDLISVSDDMRYIESHGKHYLTIGIKAEYEGGQPKVMEEDRFEEWKWFKLPDKIFEGTELMIRNYKDGKIYQTRNSILP